MDCSDRDCRKFIEQLPEAVFVETPEGDIVDVNNGACELLGYTRAELVQMEVGDLVPKDAPAFLPDQIDEATRSGEPLETINLDKAGNEIPVELRGKLIDVGDQRRMLVSVRDISERKAAEEELNRSKKRYQRYFEELGDAVFITRVGGEDHGRILDANSAAVEQTGYPREELIGMNVEEDIAVEGPKPITYEEGDEKLKQGETISFREKKRSKDGTYFWTDVVVTRIEYKGSTAALSINRDITERKKAKEQLKRYKMAVEGSEDLIAAVDQNYNYLFANRAYRGFYGVDGEGIGSYSVGELLQDKTFREEVKPRIDRCLEGERIDYEMERTHPAKEPRQLKILYYPLKEEEKIHGVVAIMRDITERKKAERELRQKEKKYRQIFNKANDAMYLHGLTEEGKPGKFLEVNDVACEMLGYSREELLDMNLTEIDAGERAMEVPDIIGSLIEEGQQTFEMLHEAKDGSKIPVEISSHLFEMNGDERVLSIVRDVTERKRSQQALNEERDKLRHLHDAVDELQQQNTEDEVLQTAVDVAESMLDFRFCDISLVEGDYIVPKASTNGLASRVSVPFEVGEGITGKTIKKGETIWGDDVRNHPEAKPTNDNFRAFISVPIGDLGNFQVISEEAGAFDEEDVELAEILADHLQEEIKRVRLEEDLREQAIHDPLTDLYNRRYFNETLGEEVERCKRYNKSLAFLMADVNRFKEINDRYTHQTGDEVLREVAALLQENVRDADTVVRYGGDEFLVMMTQTGEGVETTVNRLKKALKDWNRESDLIDFPLTLAMGVSHWSPKQKRDVEDALKEADEKMYEDKQR